MVIVVMGVCGCGKSFVGSKLAAKLNWEFLEGDSFHAAVNIEKMRAGIPLTDDDRWPWLHSIRRRLDQLEEQGKSAVLSCSALKESYRQILRAGDSSKVLFLYLKGDRETLSDHLNRRQHPYMNPKLLDSQLETLEEPPYALAVPCYCPIDEVFERVIPVLTMERQAPPL